MIKYNKEANITLNFFNGEKKTFTIETTDIKDVLKKFRLYYVSCS